MTQEIQSFNKTQDQMDATDLLIGDAKHVLLYGGSRSGKTLLFVYAVFMRAMNEKGSRHSILRYRFNHAKQSLVFGTIPDVFKICFPKMGIADSYLNKADWYYKLPNGSEVWIGGLDDKERTEKILGNEYSTMYFNECSQIPYSSVLKARTRLAQKNKLVKKFYYDENPPTRGHWTYKEFIEHADPIDGRELIPKDYVSMLMNPEGNIQNLDPEYLRILEALPEAERNRFMLGMWGEAVSGAVFGKQMNLAYKENRVCNVRYDPSKEVETWWDIGRTDYTAIWFRQDFGTEVRYIDFYMINMTDLPEIVKEIKSKPYNYAMHNLPHDASHIRLGMQGKSISQQLDDMGLDNVVHQLKISNAEREVAKTFLNKCYFDREKCRDGIECLEAYHYEYNEKTGRYKDKPEHDWASDASDAFIYSANGKAKKKKKVDYNAIYRR